MGIEIINPRHVAVSLSCKKKGGTYYVDKHLRSFLNAHGWTLQKLGTSYARMVPPDDVQPPFLFNVDIPTKGQVVAVAQEKHGVRHAWAGNVGEWVACYFPPKPYYMGQNDPFTAQVISEPVPAGVIPARFFVGIRPLWYAEVLFRDETGEYSESSSQPLYSPATCFVSPDEIPSGAHSLKVHHAILLSTPMSAIRKPVGDASMLTVLAVASADSVSGPRMVPWRKDISTFIMFARFPRSEASMWSIRLGTYDRSVQTATQCCTWTGSAVLSRMSACSWSGEGVNSSVYRCRRPRKSKGRTVPVLSHD